MTLTRTMVHRSDRLLPKVLFVDDVNTYRDVLRGVENYQIKEIVAGSYTKNWSLPSTIDGRPTNKTTNISLDPEMLPYPELKYRSYRVVSVDVALVDRQLVITFQMGM